MGVDWAFSDDAMVYGRITRGFKSGGFFGGFAFGPEELEPYDDEIVESTKKATGIILLQRRRGLAGHDILTPGQFLP